MSFFSAHTTQTHLLLEKKNMSTSNSHSIVAAATRGRELKKMPARKGAAASKVTVTVQSVSQTDLLCPAEDGDQQHMQGESDIAYAKVRLPWPSEMRRIIKRLGKVTPDRADLVPVWVTSGAESVLGSDGNYKTDTYCVFRDYTAFSTEGTHATPDMAGERGDDQDGVTVRHVAMTDRKRAAWVVVERPARQLGFETKAEYDEWLAQHLEFEYKSRAKQLDAMPGKVRPVVVAVVDEKKSSTSKSTAVSYGWPVEQLNGWFKFFWHRAHDGGRLEKTRAHCFDRLGRRYITVYGDGDRARMTKWSGTRPLTEKMERDVCLMWVNCDPNLSLFESDAADKILAPPRVGETLPIASVGLIGKMTVLQCAMNTGEPVGWVMARVTGLPDEYPAEDDEGGDESGGVQGGDGDDGDHAVDETEDDTV
jgi:hypothetical protein